jgi:hypothetical protein
MLQIHLVPNNRMAWSNGTNGKIQSEAYREVEEIRGMADAKATENMTLFLSTDSELSKFLKGMDPNEGATP